MKSLQLLCVKRFPRLVDDDEYEALASAIARVAETSLLGGGDADAMFPDFEVGTSFGDHQSWKVAL